jgi:hypothetical protein
MSNKTGISRDSAGELSADELHIQIMPCIYVVFLL